MALHDRLCTGHLGAGRTVTCPASGGPLYARRLHRLSRAALGGAAEAGQALQDVIVGGFVVSAIGAALYSGMRKDLIICDLCQGTGGAKCFGCSGQGRMDLISRDELYADPSQPAKPSQRDPLRASRRNPRECRVCKGVGMVLCSRCRGSGYVSAL